MKPIIGLMSVPALLVAGVGYFLYGQDAPSELGAGKVLLLKTGLAMEGDIRKIGSEYCVRRGPSEVRVAADKAARLCADWHDAYAFAQTQINLKDARDRLSLARWCHLHHLNEQALAEAKAAVALQPENSEARQLVLLLGRTLKERPASSPPTPVISPKRERGDPESLSVDVSFETLVAFTTKVQPILMNTCAKCHARNDCKKFQLEHVTDATRKTLTQRNLAAVLTYVDLDRPAISPLLARAVTAHGGSGTPPIKDRTSKPAQTIHLWILEAILKNPQLKDYQAARLSKNTESKKDSSGFGAVVRQSEPSASPITRGVSAQEPMTQQPWSPSHPNDPEIFNRAYHPSRFPGGRPGSR